MKVPLRLRRKKSKWDLSVEKDKPEHNYTVKQRLPSKNTTEVISICELCGCEKRVLIGNSSKNIIRTSYKRSGQTYRYSPQCWGAKNPV